MKEPASSEDKENHYLSVPRQRIRIDGRGDGRKKWETQGPKVIKEQYQSLHSCVP